MFNFHHVCMSVKNLEESAKFYTTLGFKRVFLSSPNDGETSIAHLKLNEFFLELFQHRNYIPLPSHALNYETDLQTIGIKHFALKVSSIEVAKNKIIENHFSDHVEIKRGRTGIDYFFIKDPDGIYIEIVQDDRGVSDESI